MMHPLTMQEEPFQQLCDEHQYSQAERDTMEDLHAARSGTHQRRRRRRRQLVPVYSDDGDA